MRTEKRKEMALDARILVVNSHEKEDKDNAGHIAKLIFFPFHFWRLCLDVPVVDCEDSLPYPKLFVAWMLFLCCYCCFCPNDHASPTLLYLLPRRLYLTIFFFSHDVFRVGPALWYMHLQDRERPMCMDGKDKKRQGPLDGWVGWFL